MCLPIVLKIFGPCRGSQPGFVVVWKPSFSRGENVLSDELSNPKDVNYFCSFWRPRSNMFAFQYLDTVSAGSRRDTSGHRRACSGGAQNGLSLLKIGMLYHTQSQEWGWNSQECVSMYFLPRIWDWSCLEITKQTFEIVWIDHDWAWLSTIQHVQLTKNTNHQWWGC